MVDKECTSTRRVIVRVTASSSGDSVRRITCHIDLHLLIFPDRISSIVISISISIIVIILIALVVPHALTRNDARHHQDMPREHDIIPTHERLIPVVSSLVLGTDERAGVERRVVDLMVFRERGGVAESSVRAMSLIDSCTSLRPYRQAHEPV